MNPLHRAVAVVVLSAAAAGCSSSTVEGNVDPGDAARASTALDSFLLSPEEINSAMSSTDMTPGSTQSTLVDDGGRTKPEDCLAASSVGQERVYQGTGWTAVRIQSLHEPVDDFEHLAHQAVIQFPSGSEASSFVARSARVWDDCANRGRFTYGPGGGEAEVGWLVGPAKEHDAILTMSTPQEDGDGWACRRALTAAVNIVADVMTCSYGVDDGAATQIAGQIARRATGQ